MIAIMRKLIHNNTYKIILWIFLLMMALGSGLLMNLQGPKDWSIKVYDQKISPNKFYSILRSSQKLDEEFKQRGINLGGKRNVEKEAIEACLTVGLMNHVIAYLKLLVPDHLFHKTFQERLSSLPPHFFRQDGQLDEIAFERAIAPATIQDFVQDVYESIQNEMLFNVVKQSVYTPKYELKIREQAEFASKAYSVAVVPLQKYIDKAKEKTVSPQDLERFYMKVKNNEAFKTIEKRSGVMWVFSQDNYGSAITDAEVKAYYDKVKHTKYVTEPSKIQIRSLLITAEAGKEDMARVQIHELKEKADKNPEAFVAMVKEFSQDKSSAVQGGITHFFSQQDDKIEKAVVDVAFELGTDGQISAPIRTSKGFELIQRVHRNPAKFKDLKEVMGDIRKELSSDRFKKRFMQDANRVVGQMKYNPEVLKNFVERYKGEKRELPLGMRKNTIESERLFRLEELKSVVYFDVDKGVILTCEQIEKSQPKPLAEVKEAVMNAYYEDMGKNLLNNAVEKILKSVKTHGFQVTIKEEGLVVQKAEFLYKNSKGEFSSILKTPNIMAKLKGLTVPGAVVGAESEKDYVLISLDTITPLDNSVQMDQKADLLKADFYNKQYVAREGFVDSLYRHAKLSNKIEMKEEILHLIKES